MILTLQRSPLFAGMSESDIEHCLQCSRAEVVHYEKDEMIFLQHDIPSKLLILLDGTVVIGNDSVSGKRSIIATFQQSGDLFGEVFVFLNKQEYDHYAQAVTPSKILQIPSNFLYHTCGQGCHYHTKLISNMLAILAQKAYYLNKKLQILSCTTLRQKIAKALLENCSTDGRVTISIKREELADFLSVARPSLSRELMKMQQDRLINVTTKEIIITDLEQLKNIL